MTNIVEESGESKECDELLRGKHMKYFKQLLNLLPELYQGIDSSRLTILYFGLSGLDLLGELDNISDTQKSEIIEWIYSLQVKPSDNTNIGTARCGFYATDSLPASVDENYGHVAMTYVALCSLLIMGDDLKRVDRDCIMAGLQALQLPNGAFQCSAFGSESDTRFVYCAACICYMLKDWRGLDRTATTNFLLASQSYEGGFAQNVGREAHGGSTFCSLAALHLMGTLETLPDENLARIREWCLRRQVTGFNGRPNKPVDTCYSFWVGASLSMLNAKQYLNKECNFSFLMTTQDNYIGGFSKWPNQLPDALHSYFGLAGLLLATEDEALHPALNISMRAFRHLECLQS